MSLTCISLLSQFKMELGFASQKDARFMMMLGIQSRIQPMAIERGKSDRMGCTD